MIRALRRWFAGLGPKRWAVLQALADGRQRTGLTVANSSPKLHRGTVYAVLVRLEVDGYVWATEPLSDGLRRWGLTLKGRRALEQYGDPQ